MAKEKATRVLRRKELRGMEAQGKELWEQHLVEADWLAKQIATGNSSLRVVDMRGYVHTQTQEDGFQTARYVGAREEYTHSHIPGAVYLDWTQDIVDENDPVPAQVATPEKIKQVLERVGIGDEHLIVAYDAHPASQFATRLWWVLRYYGHPQVRVLNGGWKRWNQEGHPVTAEVSTSPLANFTPNLQPEWRATAEQLRDMLGTTLMTLIDARDEGQYTGKIRRGIRGGHIPGACHLPREAFFTEQGTFRTPEELQALITATGITPEKPIVAYCNGGVAATSVLFTLSLLGFPHLTNYDGSWNEWNLREDLPIEKLG